LSVFSKLVASTTQSRPVEKLVTGTKPGKALAGRFVAGDKLEDAVRIAESLNAEGFVVSLDLLGEEVRNRDTALAAMDDYLECLARIASDGLEANISVKLTQLGLNIDGTLAREAIDVLAAAASSIGTTVTIDMEDSDHTEATVDLYADAQRAHGNLGLALQAYLRRTPDDLARLIPLGGHLRLCKGAYVEPAAIALKSKAEVDAAFVSQIRLLMGSAGALPAIATHDQAMVELTREMAGTRDRPFEFQMLYGVRPSMQRELVSAGFPLRVYLPFGSQWYPYLTRRLAERPSNTWFFVRSVFGS
jgi:proline dehydrogenase